MSYKNRFIPSIALIIAFLGLLILIIKFGIFVFLPFSFIRFLLFIWLIITLLVILYIFAQATFYKLIKLIPFAQFPPALKCIKFITRNVTKLLLIYIIVSALFYIYLMQPATSNTLVRNNNNKTYNSIITNENLPQIQLTVVKYPKQISLYCEPITLKIKVKNTGKVPLTFSDITNKKYHFAIEYGNSIWPIDNTIGINVKTETFQSGNTTIANEIAEEHSSKIINFDTIKPGETKIITILSGANHPYYYGKNNHYVFLTNILAHPMKSKKENGTYTYKVIFSWLKDNKHHPTLSSSNEFSVIGNIIDDDGHIKDCIIK